MFYKEIIQAKNGQKVPVFNSGKAAHSKYDPLREAESFLSECKNLSFAIILGTGGGYHIQALLKRQPSCKIIAVEKSLDDLAFLKNGVPCVNELSQDPRVVFCAAEDSNSLESAILSNYIPAYYGDLQIAALRPWADEAGGLYNALAERIKACLKDTSADFATQAKFGALWQRNIFCNLATLKKMQAAGQDGKENASLFVDTAKTAAIIAAGPSLDQSAAQIQAEREKYFVVAADTSRKALARRGIKVDAAVSIDAQYLSAQHFYGAFDKDTIYVLDLAANPSIGRYVYERGGKIIFTDGGHPLARFASLFCKTPFARLQNGGTVTIAALDFALKLGFKNIEIFGADFGYSRGKPYAKGSYLDDLYAQRQSRVDNAQSAFARLMYRSPLAANKEGVLQNELLLSYQKALENFLAGGGLTKKGSVYCYQAGNGTSKGAGPVKQALAAANQMDFCAFKAGLSKAMETVEKSDALTPELSTILPYMAYCEGKKNGEKISIKEAKKLALNKILLYNNMI